MKRQILMVLALFLLAVSPSCDCGGTQTTSGTGEGTPTGNTGGPTPDTGPAHDGKPGSPCDNPSECDSGICTFGRCGIDLNACETKNACGTCGNSNCKDDSVGGDGNPIDLQNDPDNLQDSNDVILKNDASTGGRPAITLDLAKEEQQREVRKYIWIAKTRAGQILKINTENYDEVALYDTGPNGASNDPSRTSINTFGDAYVANRSSRTVTKISGTRDRCVSKLQDGSINTSENGTDVKPWGQDDCVLWNTKIPGRRVRGLAAQDYDPSTGQLDPVVWAGSYDEKEIYKLDGETGTIRFRANIGAPVYGLAVDNDGNLWVSTISATLVKIDTKRCRDAASCTNTGVTGCTDGTEDECVIQKIATDGYNYGITVDNKQRVWLGGAKVCSYDRNKPFGSRVECTDVGRATAGIQADNKGRIWIGDNLGGEMIRMEADNPSNFVSIPDTTSRGVAVDLHGKIWGIPHSSASGVSVFDPDKDTVQSGVASSVVNAYTYSDMTGSQLRLASGKSGTYQRKFEGCDPAVSGGTNWLKLKWDANVPTPAKIVFSIRGAADQPALKALGANVGWNEVAVAPTDASPFDITSFIETNNLQDAGILEVRVQLEAGENKVDKMVVAPQLFSMSVVSSCKPKPTG